MNSEEEDINRTGRDFCKYIGFEVSTAVVMSIIFWDMTPCSPLLLATCSLAEPISSTLKMEAICSSETSVETQRTTRRHIPKDETLLQI
jgi:hypothetical protein